MRGEGLVLMIWESCVIPSPSDAVEAFSYLRCVDPGFTAISTLALQCFFFQWCSRDNDMTYSVYM